jgi:predicted phage tail protein
LVSPSNGATGVSTTPKLDWGDVSGAISYDVRVCSDSTCTTVERSKNVTNSQWTVSPALLKGTAYYWRVRSVNTCGASSWSNIRSFTTCTNPLRPSLVSPANGATGVATAPTLDWNDVSGATSYDVQVCSDSTCTTVVRPKSVTASQWTVSPALVKGTTYYWRVRSVNACAASPWSGIRNFTTSGP